MAISATSVLEVQTGGTDTFGGGYNGSGSSPGTDYSTSTSAHVVIDGTLIIATVQATTTQLKFSGTNGYTTASSDNRNFLQITGGTATAGFYEITAVTAGAPGTGIWTLDRSCGTAAQTAQGNMGGCLATPGKASGAMTVSGMTCYIKAGTYSFTGATKNLANGPIGPTANNYVFVGYNTTRSFGNSDTKPVLQTNVSTCTQVDGNGLLYNITFDGNTQTASRLQATNTTFVNCSFINFNTASGSASEYIDCTATTNSAAIFVGACTGCEAYANTATPFLFSSNGVGSSNCLSYANTGGSTDGFSFTSTAAGTNLTAYNNGRDGFRVTAAAPVVLTNCYADGNAAGSGFNAASNRVVLLNCATFGNLSATAGTVLSSNLSALSSSALVAPGSSNFALNNTSGAGASLRANGGFSFSTSHSFPRGLTLTYQDTGAAQHADSVGLWIQ